jgi:hypothetical protein
MIETVIIMKKNLTTLHKPSAKSRFYVNADKLKISPFKKANFIPLRVLRVHKWKLKEVEFTLKNIYSQDIQNYGPVETFPSTYEHLKNEILDWIDHFLNDKIKNEI